MSTVERFDDPAAFLRVAGGFLVEREAEHNLILGLTGRLADEPGLYGEPPYAAVAVGDGGTVVATAFRTPPFNVILSEVDDLAAVDLLAADAHDRFGALPGVVGPSAGSARFVSAWGELTGATTELVFRQRIYRARAARIPAGVPGAARAAVDADRPLLLAWVDAFFDEALRDLGHPETAEEHLARRDGDPDAGYLLWDASGVPVSMAGWGGPTPNGIRIGPVYTPPEHRRNGYGGAITAALTDRLLRGGRRFCFLFTDLANPTSNGIYRRIGYEPVSDVDQHRFGADA